MITQARAELLLSYAHGPQLLKAALAECPAEALDFQPGPGKWSVRTIVFHLAESEAHGYLRARFIIAQPGTTITPYDQDLWADSLDAAAQPLAEAVDLFRLLREMLARQLRALPEPAWARTLVHPERGVMTLEQWLEGYDGHLAAHLKQIGRTVEAWRAS
jgi:hypothetical protein